MIREFLYHNLLINKQSLRDPRTRMFNIESRQEIMHIDYDYFVHSSNSTNLKKQFFFTKVNNWVEDDQNNAAGLLRK